MANQIVATFVTKFDMAGGVDLLEDAATHIRRKPELWSCQGPRSKSVMRLFGRGSMAKSIDVVLHLAPCHVTAGRGL